MRQLFPKIALSFVYGLAFAILVAAFSGMMVVLPHFHEVSIWQALEYVTTPPSILPDDLRAGAWWCYSISIITLVGVAALHFFASGWFYKRFGGRGLLVLHASLLIFFVEGVYATFELADACFDIRREIRCKWNPSKLFADEFVAVTPSQIQFPSKRNLVVLMGESIEEAFIDGTAFGENVMPRLEKWRQHHDTFGTMCAVHGCDHTICALFGIAYGSPRLPVDFVLRLVSFSDYPEVMMPNIWRVWLDNGFNCRFFKGGELKFACTDKVFRAVPEVEIHDKNHFVNDPDYVKEPNKNTFGVNDEVTLVKHLRNETTELAQGGKPFVLVAWTLNTHYKGWVSAFKPRRHKTVHADSAAQADDMIVDYLEWLEKQPFAADTEIVFLGDHIAHISFDKADNANRHPVNVLVSKTVPPIHGTRTFAAFDLAPTFLELTGAQLPEHRFGMGTSLLSDRKTLLERIGRDKYESEIRACTPDYRRIALGWEY